MNRLPATILFLGLALLLAPRSNVDAQSYSRVPDSELQVLLATSKTDYSVGEPIRVRIGVRNAGPKTIHLWIRPVWDYFRLTVRNAAGTTVQPNPHLFLAALHKTWPQTMTIAPGSMLTFPSMHSVSETVHQDATLADFDYAPLPAGTYRLSASPTFRSVILPGTPIHFGVIDNNRIASNVLTIRVR
ncbi:MAG TPA: hypothetical protein VFA29_11690 [Candidatus Baltobacteraceae bacterium]|nr:hypothetical protein [Candidatus Baltobacteraceae bacterium]